jgi:glutamate--cysteine ligase
VHPALAASARACFRAALGALDRLGADRATRDTCARYFDQFVARRRTPADDVLDGHVEALPEPAWS